MSDVLEFDYLGDIKDAILNHDTVVIEFGASWCGPCVKFRPHFEKFAAKHPEISCVAVDIDVDDMVMSEYQIQSVPQVMLFEGGQYVKHLTSRTVLKLEQELA